MDTGDSATRLEARHRAYALAAVAAAVIAAIALRAWALHVRGVLDYDETYYWILGSNLFHGKGYTLNGLPHAAFPPLYPVCVGLVTLFTRNIRLATSLVSALAGGLLPVPLYILAREVSGRRTVGAIAAWAAAAWPALFFYAARSVPYRDRIYAGSEPLFLTLLAAGVLFIWLAARRESVLYAALGGLALGLATLTRNETLVLFAFLFAWFVADRVFAGTASRARRGASAAVLAVAFAVAVSPFIIYVHSVTGRYGFGEKLPNFVHIRPTLWQWMETGNARPYVTAHYALNDDATAMREAYWGITDWHRSADLSDGGASSALSLVAHPDWRWLSVFRRSLGGGFVPLVPWYAWLIVIAGALAPPWDRRKASWWALTGAVLAALLLQAVAVYTIARFQLPLVALLVVPFAAGLDLARRGVEAVVTRLAREARLSQRLAGASGWMLVVAVICWMAHAGLAADRRGNEMRVVGGAVSSSDADAKASRMLAAELPPGASVMTNKPWIPAEAGCAWRVSPQDTPGRIVAYAQARGIQYGLLGSWQIGQPTPDNAAYPYYVRKMVADGETFMLFDFTRRP